MVVLRLITITLLPVVTREQSNFAAMEPGLYQTELCLRSAPFSTRPGVQSMRAAIASCAAIALMLATCVLFLDGTEVRRVARAFYNDVLQEHQGVT